MLMPTPFHQVWGNTTGNTYGILATTQAPSLSYSVLQSSTGNWRILQSYPNFQGAGKMVVDHVAGLLYGGMFLLPYHVHKHTILMMF
jgi:hypothetical protein